MLLVPFLVFIAHMPAALAVDKCPAGQKFVPADKKGNPAKCEICPEGTFNPNNDASAECAEHDKCVDSGVKVAGDTTKDAVCEPVTWCAPGKKFVPADKNKGLAAKCEACSEDTFNADNDASMECMSHDKCVESGVKVAGNTTKDAVCEPVTKCAPGKKFVPADEKGNPAKCEFCLTGTFNAEDDKSEKCLPHSSKVTKCAPGQKFVPASTKNDEKCETCKPGTFNREDGKSTECLPHDKCVESGVKVAGDTTKDAVCVPVTKCAPGKKFVPADKNKGVAAKCEACSEDTFNADNDASEKCVPHDTCVDSGVKAAGDTTKDAVCVPGLDDFLGMAMDNTSMSVLGGIAIGVVVIITLVAAAVVSVCSKKVEEKYMDGHDERPQTHRDGHDEEDLRELTLRPSRYWFLKDPEWYLKQDLQEGDDSDKDAKEAPVEEDSSEDGADFVTETLEESAPLPKVSSASNVAS